MALTDADLRNWDLSFDPTDRLVGSLWGTDPFKTNMNGVGFGRVCTPESWLSIWSGLSARASVLRCAPAITQPTFAIRYTADACGAKVLQAPLTDREDILERVFASQATLHKLEVFCLVCELQSVTRVADRMRVAQPVVTAHLRFLEEKLGSSCLNAAGAGWC